MNYQIIYVIKFSLLVLNVNESETQKLCVFISIHILEAIYKLQINETMKLFF